MSRISINVNKAYQYYIDNIDKSCNKTILSKSQFEKYFTSWLNNLAFQETFQPKIVDIPEIGKCGKSRYVSSDIVISKLS